jgi:hypothetical protein
MEKTTSEDIPAIEQLFRILDSTAEAGGVKKLERLLYTTAEALLGCGPTRLYELLADNKLRARRLGPRTMIEAASLHELVDSLPLVVTPTRQRRAASKPHNPPPTPALSSKKYIQNYHRRPALAPP